MTIHHFEQPSTTTRYVHVDRAVALIKAHQHFATRTPDGLLADNTWRGDDFWYDDTQVFHVMPGTEVVDLDAVRAWLGY